MGTPAAGTASGVNAEGGNAGGGRPDGGKYDGRPAAEYSGGVGELGSIMARWRLAHWERMPRSGSAESLPLFRPDEHTLF